MMMYQIYLSILAILVFSNTIQAQFVDFSFEHSEKEYTSLVGATNITDDFINVEDIYYEVKFGLETPVNINTRDGIISMDTVVIISTEMEMYLYEMRREISKFTYYDFYPFDYILGSTQSLGISENPTEIYYLYEDDISYFEFKNMTYFYEDFREIDDDARFTFTVSIRHSDGHTIYHYGPSEFDPAIFQLIDWNIFIGLDVYHSIFSQGIYQIGVVIDTLDQVQLAHYTSYNNFDGNGLSYFPTPNTLYSFYLAEPTSQKLHAIDLDAHIFPNPAYSELHINFDTQDLNGRIEIYNSSGQLILSNLPLTNQVIQVGDLIPGLYTINFITDKGFQSVKWLKI